MAVAVAIDLQEEPLGEGIDDADADPVQSAGDLVAIATKLSAGVQHGKHDLCGALAFVAAGWVRIDGDATPVVVDPTPAVGLQRDDDAIGEPGHRFVDCVVDDLPNEVVQTGQPGGTDVHPGTLAHRIETLENLDVLGAVVA